MQCDKCNSGMSAKKVYRLNSGLAILGWIVMVPSIFMVLIGGCTAVVGTSATGNAAVEVNKQAVIETVGELEKIEGLDPAVIDEFRGSDPHKVSAATLNKLDDDVRWKVDSALTGYSATMAGAAIGTGMAAAAGGFMVLVLFVLGIPGFIVGFLLTLKKKVWTCSCGYIMDRA